MSAWLSDVSVLHSVTRSCQRPGDIASSPSQPDTILSSWWAVSRSVNISSTAAAGPTVVLLKFVAHHRWDPEQRRKDPDHGMPETVAQSLRDQGLLRSLGRTPPIPSNAGLRRGRL
jgi:hypothetical protein